LLDSLKDFFTDGDVQLMLLVLQTVGQQLRTAEPESFKKFLEGVETKMVALAGAKELSQRSRLMLELIVEMKNSKKIKEKHGAGSLESNLNADVMHQLRSCDVAHVTMHNLTWQQVGTREFEFLQISANSDCFIHPINKACAMLWQVSSWMKEITTLEKLHHAPDE
jgi:hypothetical protein